MNKAYRFVAVLALMLAMVSVEAQEVSPVDFMRLNPYQMNSNPATDLPYESVMSLVVGNIGLDVQNTGLHYDNFFDFDAQGRPETVNLRKLANGLNKNNFLGLNVNEDLFTLYRRLNKGMITINYRIRANAEMTYNDGAFKLLAYGNSAFVGADHPAEVALNVNAAGYQEFAVGYQRNITDALSIGARAKVLFGVANVTTDALEAKLFTDADSYALCLQENVGVRAALPNAVYVDEAGKLKGDGPFKVGELFRNPGFGVDLAAEYRFNKQFSAVAAVHDLGFIHWGKNNISMTGKINDVGQFYEEGNFLFSGLDWEQIQLISSDLSYREGFLDTLQQYFRLELAPCEKYNTALNANLLLRGNYDVDSHNRFSAQVQGCFLRSGFRPALTLAYCGSFWDNLNVCATYTMMPGSYDNFGIGLSAMIATCNIYLTTNNILGCFNPLNSSHVNAQVGIVFNLFRKGRHTIDESEMPEYLE